MKNISGKIISVLLVAAMLAGMGISAFAAGDTTSEEYKFFSKVDCSVDPDLSAAFNNGRNTGNWDGAKSALLDYYTEKFSAMDWITYDSEASVYFKNALYDTLCFSETIVDEKTVSTQEQLVTYSLSPSYVREGYMFMSLVNSDSGIWMPSKESGRGATLTVKLTDDTVTLNATGDTYIRATGVGKSDSNASTAFGAKDTNNLWAMHQIDAANQMPYNSNEMRTYISFDISQLDRSKIQSAELSVYAQVKKPDSSAAPAGTTLPLVLLVPYYKSWSESTLTWNEIKNENSFGTFSWNGFDGIIYSESLYGTIYSNLGVLDEYVNSSSRFYEESSLIQKGYYEEAKDMLVRFCQQTYDVIKNGTGFPVGRPLEPANRMLELPYIYRNLLMKGLLTPEENYIVLRWTLENINNIDDEISHKVFLNGGDTIAPNITANWGAWHITAFYNSFAFWNEFTDAPAWKDLFERRLSALSDVLIDDDGSYREVTLGYPVDVVQWFTHMLNYMSNMNFESEASGDFRYQLIRMTKYLLDCTYPSGNLPHYGDGSGGNIINTTDRLFSIKDIENDDSLEMSNLLWYVSGGTKGEEPAHSAVYKKSKLVIDRTGWTADDSMFFMNAKSGGKHAHADALSILFYSRGRNFLEDVGTLTYDDNSEQFHIRDYTRYHNTVEVDGKGQKYTGWDYIEGGVNGTDDNINMYSNSSASTVRAYSDANVDQKVKHRRNVTYIKAFNDLMIVNDSLEPGSPSSKHTYTQNWHCDPKGLTSYTTVDKKVAYTNYSSGANMMIAQSDSVGNISTQECYSDNNSGSKSKYIEFAIDTAKKGNVSFNTAIYTYNGNSGGVAVEKLDSGENDKDYVASAMNVKLYDNTDTAHANLTGEVVYYNSFENSPSERTATKYTDGSAYNYNAQKFTTDAGNSFYYLKPDGAVNMLYISTGSKLSVFSEKKSGVFSSATQSPVASLTTSVDVTDLTVTWDASTATVSIDSSDDGVVNRTTNVTAKFDQLASGAIQNVVLNGVKLINGENVTISGNTVTLSANSLFFDYKNDKAASDRYAQSAYGSVRYNFDTGCWYSYSVRNSIPVTDNSGEGTLSTTLNGSTGLGNSYVQVSANSSLLNGSQCLSYNISNADVVQLKVKFENCVTGSNSIARFYTASSYGSSDFNWKYSSKAFTCREGEYTIINIPVTDEIRALGSIITFRVEFNNLTAVDSSKDCKVVFDYIFIGKVMESPAGDTHVLYYNSEDTVIDQKTVSYSRPYGTLLTLTRDNYIFEGWYTQPTGGTKLTADLVVSGRTDETVYAHWTAQLYEITFDNLFNFNEWRNNSESARLNVATKCSLETSLNCGDLSKENGIMKVTTEAGCEKEDIRTRYGASSSYYNMPVEPNTEYRLSMNVEITGGASQFYVFIYDSEYNLISNDTRTGGKAFSDSNGVVHFDGTSSNNVFYEKTFTTTDHTAYVQIRFGNQITTDISSTFTSIRLEKEELALSTTWPTVGKAFEYGTPSGSLPIPTRAGYYFDGWYTEENGQGTKITDENYYLLNENTCLHSNWIKDFAEITYDNEFSFVDWKDNPDSGKLRRQGNAMSYAYNYGELSSQNGIITITTNPNGGYTSQQDNCTDYGEGSKYYNMPVNPNTAYKFSFDVVNGGHIQAYVFAYTSAYKASSVKSIPVSTSSSTASGRITLEFTAPSDTSYIQIRIGNSDDFNITSKFSNIRITEKALADSITYSSAGKLVRKNEAVGELMQPVREGYVFDGWYIKGTDTEVTEEYVINESLHLVSRWSVEEKYTVSFKNYDNTVLQSGEWKKGSTPAYNGSTPLKPSDDTNEYIFSGWSPAVSAVTGNAAYTAQFTAKAHSFVYVDDGDGNHSYKCKDCGYVKLSEGHHSEYQYNGNQHWLECSECDYQSAAENHSIVHCSNEQGHWDECTVCGYKSEVIAHTFGAYQTDGTYHWKTCDCGYTTAKTAHTTTHQHNDSQHWDECTVCGLKQNVENHTLGAYQTDGTYHWKTCDCGYATAKTAHTTTHQHNDSQHWDECSVCGLKLNVENHTLGAYQTDGTYHWKNCDCGYTTAKTAHSITHQHNDTQHWDECSVCGLKQNVENHTLGAYQTDGTYHWKTCDCGYTTAKTAHSITHQHNDTQHWDECSVCGLKQNVENHALGEYQSDGTYHWKTCDCGYITAKTAHSMTYVNLGEKHQQVCSVCHYARPAEDHVLDGDGKCIYCDYYVAGTSDYTDVDEAIENVPARLVYYSDESVAALEAAINAVQRDLNSSRQSEVNAMAEAINKAVAELTPKQYSIDVPEGCTVTQKYDKNMSEYYYVATIQAPAYKNGDYFTYWVDENGTNVGTYRTYSFYVTKDVSLTPVYVPASEYMNVRNEKIIATRVVDCRDNMDSRTYSILSEYALSETSVGNVIGHGIIYTTDSSLAGLLNRDHIDDDGIYSRAADKSASSYTGLYETVIENVRDGSPVEDIWAVAYVIYGDGDYFYSEVKHVKMDADISTSSVGGDVILVGEELNCVQNIKEEIITADEAPESVETVKTECWFISWIIWLIKTVVRFISKTFAWVF